MRLEPQYGLRKLPGTNAFILSPEEVEMLWDLIEPMIVKSVNHSFGTITVPIIRAMLCNQSATAFLIVRDDSILSVFVANIIPYSTRKTCRIIAAGGREMNKAIELIDVLITWALSQDAVELEGWCRPSVERMLRKYGFQHRQSIVTLDLRRKMQ